MAFTPSIGAAGLFTLSAPFDKLLTPKVVYTCRSIRTINDCIAAGEDPYTKYYSEQSVAKTKYNADVANNVTIVGLQSGTGDWVYVPDTYIAAAPDMNGVKYTSVVLGVELGAVPDSLNLDALKKSVSDLVVGYLGITPRIKGVIVSQPSMISHDDHDRLEIARKAKITQTTTDFARANKAEADLAEAVKKVAVLEKYIKDKLL